MERARHFSIQNLVSVLTLLFVFFPLLVLFSKLQMDWQLDWGEVRWALANTFAQALGSALLSVLGGFVFSLGLLHLRQHSQVYQLTSLGLLLFNFLPAIFVIVFAMDVIEPFPVGTLGIVLVHALVNTGPVALLWTEQLVSEFAGPLQLAYLEGARRSLVLGALGKPLLKTFGQLLLLVFVICFSSFTIPLVIGGGRGTTLEVLIYEKIRISGSLNAALTLSLMQGFFVFLLSYLFLGGKASRQDFSQRLKNGAETHANRIRILPSVTLGYFLPAVVGVTMIYLAWGMVKGWRQIAAIDGLSEEILALTPGTFFLGLAIAVGSFFLLAAQAYVSSRVWSHRFLARIVTLSPVLVGFSFLLVGFQSPRLSLLLALLCLYFPTLFRFLMAERLRSLAEQEDVAYLLGATAWQIFFFIKLPQLSRYLAAISAMAGLWAMGDFAIAKLLSPQALTLGMMAESLLGSYRIDAAFAIIGVILFLGVALFVTCKGLVYVYGQKLSQKLR